MSPDDQTEDEFSTSAFLILALALALGYYYVWPVVKRKVVSGKNKVEKRIIEVGGGGNRKI